MDVAAWDPLNDPKRADFGCYLDVFIVDAVVWDDSYFGCYNFGCFNTEPYDCRKRARNVLDLSELPMCHIKNA